MSKKILSILILLLVISFATEASASLTFTSTAITGTADSAIDLGTGHTLSLQTTGNAPITAGTGLVTLGGNLNVVGNTTTPLVLGGTTTTSPLTFKTTTGVGTTGADIIFQTGNNGATEAMRILNSGNVGIGTTAPAYKLSVSGDVGFNSLYPASGLLYIRGAIGGGDPTIFFQDMDNSSKGLALRMTTDGTDAGTFLNILDNGGSPLVTITQYGEVGIGTTTPTESLDVNGQVSISASNAHLEFDGSGDHYIDFDPNDKAYIYYYAGDNSLNLETSSSGGNIFINPKTGATGKVGIGNYGASYKLDITGDLRSTLGAYFATSSGGVGIGTASINANAILDVSSTTKAFMPPRMTTTQRDAISGPTAGMVIYNTSTNKLNVYTTAWEAVTSI